MTRIPVEVCLVLDVNSLLQKGALRPGVCRTINWSSVDAWGKTVQEARIGIEATPRGIALCYTTTEYDGNRTEYDYTVLVVWTRCHFGGRRLMGFTRWIGQRACISEPLSSYGGM